MLYVVLATFAAGMATEYFLGNRWIGFFAVGVPACLYFFFIIACNFKKFPYFCTR